MRPRMFYAVFEDGRVASIHEGAEAARKALGDYSRAYRSFKTRIEAEEFALWWNYERQPLGWLARLYKAPFIHEGAHPSG